MRQPIRTILSPGTRRLCMALDIEKYSSRRNVDHLALQEQLTTVVRTAFDHARVEWQTTGRQDQGDGLLLLLPQGIDEPTVLGRLVTGLGAALDRVNSRVVTSRQMRLRTAFTEGVVHQGASGYAGDAVVAVCRLVDSDVLRAALSSCPNRDLAVIVSDGLYRDVVSQGYPGLDAAAFRQTAVDAPAKGFSGQAWICVPEPAGWVVLPEPGGPPASGTGTAAHGGPGFLRSVAAGVTSQATILGIQRLLGHHDAQSAHPAQSAQSPQPAGADVHGRHHPGAHHDAGAAGHIPAHHHPDGGDGADGTDATGWADGPGWDHDGNHDGSHDGDAGAPDGPHHPA